MKYYNGIKEWKIVYFILWMIGIAVLVLMETKTCSPQCELELLTQRAICTDGA